MSIKKFKSKSGENIFQWDEILLCNYRASLKSTFH